jgi:hypothetical protein
MKMLEWPRIFIVEEAVAWLLVGDMASDTSLHFESDDDVEVSEISKTADTICLLFLIDAVKLFSD